MDERIEKTEQDKTADNKAENPSAALPTMNESGAAQTSGAPSAETAGVLSAQTVGIPVAETAAQFPQTADPALPPKELPRPADKKRKVLQLIARYLVITIGCFSLGAGIALFLDPNKLAPGGLSGVAIILNKFVPQVSTGMWMLILNIPLLITGLVVFGKSFLFSTVYATVMLSVATDVVSWLFRLFWKVPLTDDLLLAALFGGMLCALGLGLVFRNKCTTGGLDIVVMLIHKKCRYMSVGILFLIIDFIVAGISAIVFRSLDIGLYACIGIIVYSLLMDVVIYGGNGAKLIYIVSDKPAAIAQRLLTELEVGATYVEGVGAYTNDRKKIILVAVKKHLYPRLRDIVREEDTSAFMIVGSAKDVYGLGFRNHQDEL